MSTCVHTCRSGTHSRCMPSSSSSATPGPPVCRCWSTTGTTRQTSTRGSLWGCWWGASSPSSSSGCGTSHQRSRCCSGPSRRSCSRCGQCSSALAGQGQHRRRRCRSRSARCRERVEPHGAGSHKGFSRRDNWMLAPVACVFIFRAFCTSLDDSCIFGGRRAARCCGVCVDL